jgi:type I restriction enzyme, S subunit
MKLSKYPNYKNTQIEWLGEVPEHWEVRRVKDIFNYFGSGTTPKSTNELYYENGTTHWLNTSDLNNDLVFDTKYKISPLALKEVGLKIYPINAIAMAMYGQGKTRGSVGLLKVKTTSNQASCIMYKSFNANEKYVLWWFISKYDDMRFINVGATQPNMNQDFVKNLLLNLPPLSEQTAIANYLDSTTQALDKKVRLLELKIKYYDELKKAIINETVTRGLDKNVALKDSGVDYIGQIPKHWKILRGKDALKVEYGIPLDASKFSNNPNDGFPIIRIRDLNNQEVQTYYKGEVVKGGIVNNGDLLIGMDGDFQSVRWLGGKALLNQRICNIKDSKKVKVSFLSYYLPIAIQEINETKFFTTVKHLSDFDLKFIQIIVPPLSEQIAIAEYLDTQTNQIDLIVQNLQQQIEKQKELRKSLINEVVTGKVKVY